MNVEDIIVRHLKSVNANGLCSESCGCGIDNLFPCGNYAPSCVPAKRVRAEEDGDEYNKGDEIYMPMEAVK